MPFDLTPFAAAVRAGLGFAGELAKLTGNEWDDDIVAKAAGVIELFLGPRVYGAGPDGDAGLALAVGEESAKAALPAWLIPIIFEIVRRLLAR